eukprot:SM010243S09152  [mRNA]  locus=s10243:117:522:+ [translate_table: standard]
MAFDQEAAKETLRAGLREGCAVDVDLLASLHPDLVITRATADNDLPAALQAAAAAALGDCCRVLCLPTPRSLAEALGGMAEVAA